MVGKDGGVDFAVWFDNLPPDADTTIRISIRGQKLAPDQFDESDEEGSIPFDVLLHIPTARASPMRRSIAVPLKGRSEPLSFSVPTAELDDGLIPRDTLLELRCRGTLIQVIDLQVAGRRGAVDRDT
jgi:hypothetical protein